jgi:hypothetical protein
MTLRADLAEFIRHVDADNELGPHQLAVKVAVFLSDRVERGGERFEIAVTDYAEELNRGAGYRHPKPLTAEALADAVIDRFRLEGPA